MLDETNGKSFDKCSTEFIEERECFLEECWCYILRDICSSDSKAVGGKLSGKYTTLNCEAEWENVNGVHIEKETICESIRLLQIFLVCLFFVFVAML